MLTQQLGKNGFCHAPARSRVDLASCPPQGEGSSRACGAARPSSKRWSSRNRLLKQSLDDRSPSGLMIIHISENPASEARRRLSAQTPVAPKRHLTAQGKRQKSKVKNPRSWLGPTHPTPTCSSTSRMRFRRGARLQKTLVSAPLRLGVFARDDPARLVINHEPSGGAGAVGVGGGTFDRTSRGVSCPQLVNESVHSFTLS